MDCVGEAALSAGKSAPTMTARERVQAAFAHREPDRVPLDFMGTAGGMADRAYFALLAHLGLEGEGRQFRHGESVRHYDQRVLDKLGVDFRRVWLRPPENWTPPPTEEGMTVDEWGMRRVRMGAVTPFVNAPLQDASVHDLELYAWPRPDDPGRVRGLAEEARDLRQRGDWAIAARAPLHGMFDLAQRLRGVEQFLIDLLLDRRFAEALVGKIKDLQLGFYSQLLEAAGPFVDMVETSDDFGTQAGLLISPELFQEVFAPARRELNELIKAKTPGARVFFHSDGAISKIIPQLIDIGVEVLNPVEPDVPGNDSYALKERFGTQLTFHGHLDVKGALRGSREDVRAEVRRAIDGLSHGGGYILAPTNHLQPDVPPENLLEAYRYAADYGRRVRSANPSKSPT
jgi:uroporphyrinogen decarboxylase